MNKAISKSQYLIRHIWSVICQRTTIDAESNRLTLSDVLEQVAIEKQQFETIKRRQGKNKIAIPLSLELVTMWSRDDVAERKMEGRTRILDPNGNKLVEKTHTLKFERNKKRMRFRVKIDGLPITVAGEYIFLVEIKEEGAERFEGRAQIPLDVKFTELNSNQKNK